VRVAVLGIRGVPANFGGSETAAEEIGSRLAKRGHEVTVYCRKHKDSLPGQSHYRGMRRIVLPSLNTLNLDLITHTFVGLLQMMRERFDVVHFHGVGNALWLPLFKSAGRGAKSLLIVDGPDWQRPKWGKVARLAFRLSFPMAARFADEIISDNVQVQDLFRAKYDRETPLVGYGADHVKPTTCDALTQFGLEPKRYILQVAALVPDKGVHVLVEAYERLETDLRLVIVGDTPYMTAYRARVQSTKDNRIRFLGYLYGLPYRQLLANCYMYIHPLIVDGTSPALLQAMAYRCPVIGSDLPEIDGTLADTGLRFKVGDSNDLCRQMTSLLANPALASELGTKAHQRILSHFNWDSVTDEYERLSMRLLDRE
jgi:glycosyltransferase involved in cell wall biosynthesis